MANGFVKTWLGGIALLALVGGGMQLNAASVHPDNDYFELDGNKDAESNVSGDDWSNFENGDPTGAFASSGIIHDGINMSIFTGGGSKDVRDVSSWKWTDGSVPDKDEIIHAAAAAYNIDGELIVYLHGDRYSNDGSAQMGVWFFQDRVGVNMDGTFSGVHQNGDLLMLAEFTQGGAQAHLKLYKWNDALKDNLELFAEGEGGEDEFYFAISNGTPTAAWDDYTPKSGDPQTYPANSFFEGGINLTWIFGEDAPCFSSFVMETRSSHRVNAQLKDFVIGSLDTCKITLSKSCTASVIDPTEYVALQHTYSYTVTNAGFGTIDSITLRDNAGTPNDETDDIDLSPVGPLDRGTSYTGTFTVTSTLNPPTNILTATGHVGEYAMAPVEANATCDKVILSPEISVTKGCEQSLESVNGYVVVRVDYGGQVCNEANGTKLTNVWVDDTSVQGSFGPFTLYPADDPAQRDRCAGFNGVYYPTQTTKKCAKNFMHSNTVTATGVESLNSTDVNATATASCSLCEAGCTEPVLEP